MVAEFGHDLALVTDRLSSGSPDPLVAAAAVQMGRILVSLDRDMRGIERFVSQGDQDRFPAPSRSRLCSKAARSSSPACSPAAPVAAPDGLPIEILLRWGPEAPTAPAPWPGAHRADAEGGAGGAAGAGVVRGGGWSAEASAKADAAGAVSRDPAAGPQRRLLPRWTMKGATLSPAADKRTVC